MDRVAGVDEVGRGALCGPVVAAAVVLPWGSLSGLRVAGVRDSKTLSPQRRYILNQEIRRQAQDCQIALASVEEIDTLNILQASLLAMGRALSLLHPPPTLCLVDGNQAIPHLPFPQQTLVGGDRQELVIAAASIVAKVWRDELMNQLARAYPGYDLEHNKGYGTKVHRQALVRLGPSPCHRHSFQPVTKSRPPSPQQPLRTGLLQRAIPDCNGQ